MISTLTGIIQSKGKGTLTVLLGGVGLEVYVPNPLFEESKPGDKVSLRTYLVVREDALTLYGFETSEEKEYFILLMGVTGIGPRLALAVMTTLSPEAIRRAVFHEQPEVLTRVPGIGKKTAQRALFHLQDRIGDIDDLSQVAQMRDVDTELLEALTSLGYSVVEAQAAIQAIPRDTSDDIEIRLPRRTRLFRLKVKV